MGSRLWIEDTEQAWVAGRMASDGLGLGSCLPQIIPQRSQTHGSTCTWISFHEHRRMLPTGVQAMKWVSLLYLLTVLLSQQTWHNSCYFTPLPHTHHSVLAMTRNKPVICVALAIRFKPPENLLKIQKGCLGLSSGSIPKQARKKEFSMFLSLQPEFC